MKKFFLSFFVFAASAGYVAYQSIGGNANVANTPPTPATSTKNTQVVASIYPPPQVTPAPIKTDTPPPTPVVAKPITPIVVPPPTPAPVAPVVAPPPVAVKPKGLYIDGTYDGSTEDAYYGMVQVQAVIQGGRLSSVSFLQYPNDRRTSENINSRAMPLLISEAIQAQSANVSGVSGASETSPAFIRSLATALARAKNS